jgi:hypothetical protein
LSSSAPVTAITVTHCDKRDSPGVRYPPICAVVPLLYQPATPALERVIWARLAVAASAQDLN